MNAVIQDLVADHRRMIRVLRLIRTLIDDARAPGPFQRTALGDCFRYLSDYPARVHHPREEAMFEMLVSRDADAGSAVRILNREHVEMDRRNDCILAMLEDGSALDHQELILKVTPIATQYIEKQVHHMRTEEGVVFPMIDKVLLMSDWKTIIRDFGSVGGNGVMPSLSKLEKGIAETTAGKGVESQLTR